MTLAFALVAGVLAGTGAYLALKRDLLRVVAGIVLIANAANLTLMASGRTRGSSPILPVDGEISDPLVQAMTVTALVIGFAVIALLLSLVYRVYTGYHTLDLDELSEEEARHAREVDRQARDHDDLAASEGR
ncbi:MAG TPA: sodium:proton antiporter [Solirubrobacteraceae bacterium]|nr:sodium:proton antiporter [Solirubrobacteraceae bacterium]